MSVLTLVELNVKPECVNEFKAYLKENLPNTRAFKGCRGIELHINQDEPTNMIVVEKWETREDHQKFLAWREETGRAARTRSMLSDPGSFRYYDKTDA